MGLDLQGQLMALSEYVKFPSNSIHIVWEKKLASKGFTKNSKFRRGIIKSKFNSELRDLIYKVILWPLISVCCFKETAYTVCEKRTCTQRFNQKFVVQKGA